MKPDDPLARLLQKWQPENPNSNQVFVTDTIRRLREARHAPASFRWAQACFDFLDRWLPAPRILLPATACAVALAIGLQWNSISRETRNLAALGWEQTFSQPGAQLSIAGAWIEAKKEIQ